VQKTHFTDLADWTLPASCRQPAAGGRGRAERGTAHRGGRRHRWGDCFAGRARHQQFKSQVRHAELNAILDGGERVWKDYRRAILLPR